MIRRSLTTPLVRADFATDPSPVTRTGEGKNSKCRGGRGLGAFAQMLLNDGTYGEQRMLSRAGVAAMTRPQVNTSLPCRHGLAMPSPDFALGIQ